MATIRAHCAILPEGGCILLDHLIDRAADAVEIVPLRAQRLEAWVKRQPHAVAQWVHAAGFTAKAGSTCLVPNGEGGLAQVLAGIEEGLDRWSMAPLPTSLPQGDYRLSEEVDGAEAEAACFAWAIGGYRFQRYRKRDGALARLAWPEGVDRAAIRRTVAAMTLARDLINTPAEDMGPPHLAAAVKEVAKRHKAKVSVIAGDDLLKKNYPAIHAVGRAAARPPHLIDMSWGTSGPRLVLVGKGVCFDTGGLDLKPSSAMLMMKKDMGGAALMLALAQMIMGAGLKIRLRLLIPAVENAVSGNAYRPLDVIRTRKGITVEIGNTDAEGRVILCDALAEAHGSKAGDKPDLILDAATLTGAARVALGPDLPALFCNDDDIADALLRHAKAEDDPMWRLPLHKGYRTLLDSKVADINNVSSGPFAGAITAALYLQEFIDPGQRWAHIDTFAWNSRDRPGRPEGGEALALRALFSFVSAWAQPKKAQGSAIIAPKPAPRPRPLKQRTRRRR
jgi:leucyl aminopeptidase